MTQSLRYKCMYQNKHKIASARMHPIYLALFEYYLETVFNSLSQRDAYMCQQTMVLLAQVMTCSLSSCKLFC